MRIINLTTWILATIVEVNCAEMHVLSEDIEEESFDDDFGIYSKNNSYFSSYWRW